MFPLLNLPKSLYTETFEDIANISAVIEEKMLLLFCPKICYIVIGTNFYRPIAIFNGAFGQLEKISNWFHQLRRLNIKKFFSVSAPRTGGVLTIPKKFRKSLGLEENSLVRIRKDQWRLVAGL